MNKLPVLATIREAYSFTFQHLGSIIGLIWLPMVIVSVTGFFTLQNFFGAMIDLLGGSNPAAFGPAMLMLVAYLVVSLLLYAVMYSAVVQLALGMRQGGAMMHFALGAAEWRLFRSLLALAGVAFLLMMAAMMVVFVASLVLGTSGARLTPLQSSLLLMVALYVVLAIVVPRFLIPLPAIAVSEEVPALRRAWALSAGNFPRLLGINVAVFAPSIIIMQLAESLMPGSGTAATAVGEQAQTIAVLQQQRTAMPLASGIAFFVAPLTIGLLASASAGVWRALTQVGQTPAQNDN